MAFAIGVEDGLEAEVMYLIGTIAYLLYLTWMVQLNFFRIFGYPPFFFFSLHIWLRLVCSLVDSD